MTDIFEKIGKFGIVPVVSVPNEESAFALAKGLVAGGLPLVEITLRTPAAIDAVRIIAKQFPEIILGAETILTKEQADEAVEAGAKFLVSPGFDPELVSYCLEKGYDFLPGVSTATEIQAARKFGLKYLKYFPGVIGGVSAIKQLSGPYPDVKFVVTGGITEDNLRDFLSVPSVAAVGGSLVASREQIASNDSEGIAETCRKCVQKIFNFHIPHIGINTENEAESKQTAEFLSKILGLSVIPYDTCNFAGTLFEVMKGKGRGRLGHIAIGTSDIHRAAAYVERMGIVLDWENPKFFPDGSLLCVFFKDDIAGFAFHLLQR